MNVYTNLSDSELIVLLQQQDHDAFNEIYVRHSPKIIYQVSQLVRNPEVTKDLVQELFMNIWTKSANIKSTSGMGGYLYIAAQNSVFRYIQRGKFQNDYLKSVAEFSTELTDNTNETLDEKDLHQLIDEQISKLPAKMRQVFELSRLENLSYAQIAAQLNISEHTVRNQISNALKVLREKLSGQAPPSMIIIALLWNR